MEISNLLDELKTNNQIIILLKDLVLYNMEAAKKMMLLTKINLPIELINMSYEDVLLSAKKYSEFLCNRIIDLSRDENDCPIYTIDELMKIV